MPALAKKSSKSTSVPDNALARNAIEAIHQIERESKEKKMAQLESLVSASEAIQRRMDELCHQLAQIDAAISSIKGTPVKKERRPRHNWDEERERVGRWMEGRKGQKFAARDLIREFPELDGTVVSVFLKPLVQEGKVQADVSEGVRRSKYFVAE